MAGTTVGVEARRGRRCAGAAVPAALVATCLLWLTAVLAGVVETVVQVSGLLAESGPSTGVAVNVAIRAVVYTAVVVVVALLWRGRRWTRPLLAVGLGGVGMLSLVVEPVRWVLAGGSLPALLASADATFAAVALTRSVHVAAVLAALVLMFTPQVSAYLRRERQSGRRRKISANSGVPSSS